MTSEAVAFKVAQAQRPQRFVQSSVLKGSAESPKARRYPTDSASAAATATATATTTAAAAAARRTHA